MPIKNMPQPELIILTDDIRLKKPNETEWNKGIEWYGDRDIMYYSEGKTDETYMQSDITRMYSYLSKAGELYFIEVMADNVWHAIGDVTLSEENFPIIIGDKRYWGKGIGTLVIGKLVERAREIGIMRIYVPEIYNYNERSKRLFTAFGFVKVAENDRASSYELYL